MPTPSSPSGNTAVSRALVDIHHAQSIAASHERCRAFGLAEHGAPDLRCLKGSALQELQQRNARLCAQAQPVMDMLYQQLTQAQSIVLLTDASGCVLRTLGDAGFMERAQQVALAPGALWAEAEKGTNAVGTALMTESPTVVHGQEHYLRAMQFLTCSAAPIFDHRGALLGVIDVSGDRRSFHPHTLALVSMAARLIESQWFAEHFRHATRLHLHSSADGLGTLDEAQLALDEDGCVLGTNRRALELLGLSAAALRRSSLGQLFGCSLGALARESRARPDAVLQLSVAGSAALPLHAKLSLAPGSLDPQRRELREAPAPSPLPRTAAGLAVQPAAVAPSAWVQAERLDERTAAPASLREAEELAIKAALQACEGNLSATARQLGIGRSTLYRKLKALA